MDFMQRGDRPQQAVRPNEEEISSMNQQPTPMSHMTRMPKGSKKLGSLSFAFIALLFSATLLVVALLAYLGLGNKAASLYDSKKMQAVFLNGGQVYFGNLSDVNKDYIKLKNIYYLRVDQQVQPQTNTGQAQQSISLAKLGCELHGPEDSMIINRTQVLFWEDLKNGGNDQDGQVVTAVKQFVKDNPNGQKCSTGTGNNGGSTTPTTTPTPSTSATPVPTATKKP